MGIKGQKFKYYSESTEKEAIRLHRASSDNYNNHVKTTGISTDGNDSA